MKKSLLLLMMCATLGTLSSYAQDDDVYFVPSSKGKVEKTENNTSAARSSYTPINSDREADESNWADGRGNGGWDVDTYNRRGKNYKGQNYAEQDTARYYDQGYEDGYADGSYTARIVRFYSPRMGVYVSSPYYLDYYDLCYDPWYYGYGCSWGWSGWWGWGSWYGWRPYYSSWYWGWGGWYDPWWGPSYAWHYPHYWHHNWLPAGAERGPRGGYIAYGGRRGSGAFTSAGRGGVSGSRPSNSFGYSRSAGRGSNLGINESRPSRSFGNSTRPSSNYGNSRNDIRRGNSSNNNSFNNSRTNNENNRSFRNSSSDRPSRSFSQPSRSSGGSFGSGSRSGFGGSGSRGGFGGGGSRSVGGRR